MSWQVKPSRYADGLDTGDEREKIEDGSRVFGLRKWKHKSKFHTYREEPHRMRMRSPCAQRKAERRKAHGVCAKGQELSYLTGTWGSYRDVMVKMSVVMVRLQKALTTKQSLKHPPLCVIYSLWENVGKCFWGTWVENKKVTQVYQHFGNSVDTAAKLKRRLKGLLW